MTDKILLTMNFLLMVAIVLLAVEFHIQAQNKGFFARVPVDEVYTMIVAEDGFYEIEYENGTFESGFLPERTK